MSESIIGKKLDTFLEVESNNWGLAFEWLECILFVNSGKLFCESLFKSLENVDKEVSKEIEDFEVVFIEHHFDIETCELAQVAVSV